MKAENGRQISRELNSKPSKLIPKHHCLETSRFGVTKVWYADIYSTSSVRTQLSLQKRFSKSDGP